MLKFQKKTNWKRGRGFYYLMNGLQLERLCFLPSLVATMEFAISESLNYMSQRKAFGRTIDKFEVLRHRVAQLSSELEAIKAFSYFCCDLYDKQIYDVKLCSMGKLLVTELQEKISTQCLQFFGVMDILKIIQWLECIEMLELEQLELEPPK